MIRLLYVDRNPSSHLPLKTALKKKMRIIPVVDPTLLLDLIERIHPDIILINLAIDSFFSLLKAILSCPLSPPVLITGDVLSVDVVIHAMREGAYDFIPASSSLEQRIARIEATLSRFCPPPTPDPSDPSEGILLGHSPAICKLREIVRLYAKTEAPLLITGESGTGKELVAKMVHTLYPGEGCIYVSRNCGAFSPSTIESELFGSYKGAFTDAVDRAGCFEIADGGSLFLDEIGCLSYATQSKLLRVLEEGSVVRMGGETPLPIKVRVITASNEDLIDQVRRRLFREDLLYRINALQISVPPLRDHPEDIPLLANHYLEVLGKESLKTMTPHAFEKLVNHSWPGNVRELINTLYRAIALSDEERMITSSHILFSPSLASSLPLTPSR